jgi:lysophospholipase L1-like esterase
MRATWLRCGTFLAGVLAVLPLRAAAADDWVEPMKQAHARFHGTPGTFAHFGDSITVSLAFWAPLAGEPKGLSPEAARAHGLVKGYLRPECWARWKGPEYGNNGSMTIRWANENIDRWLKQLNPEAALVLFGTNDLDQLKPEEYEQQTREVVETCLKNGTVVILTTPPPRSGRLEPCRRFAEAVRKVGKEQRVPVIDYFEEVLKRRPDDWDGSSARFKEVPGGTYDVPTLLARDGVHPSNPRQYQDYSEESLKNNGYALRNYLTLMAYADVVRKVLRPAKEK